jgi:hypothetical protein
MYSRVCILHGSCHSINNTSMVRQSVILLMRTPENVSETLFPRKSFLKFVCCVCIYTAENSRKVFADDVVSNAFEFQETFENEVSETYSGNGFCALHRKESFGKKQSVTFSGVCWASQVQRSISMW